MNKIKCLKIFAFSTAMMIPTVCFTNSKYEKVVKNKNRASIVYEIENNTVKLNGVFEPIGPKEVIPPVAQITTALKTTTTTVTTTTQTTTTTEPVDEYKDIRNLEMLSNNDLSISELKDFIVKYSGYAKLDYKDALKVINDNVETIESDYSSIRGGIMCTLFTYSNEQGILSPYTSDREIREDMTQEEKESIMIEFCDNLCMCNDDKYIVLSAFREETWNGTSSRCVYDNNYGGIRIYGEAGCNGEYGMYSTPEFGIYREVKLIYNKLVSIRNNGTSDINSVVYSFACKYNPEYASTYSNKIMGWVYNVQNEYGDFSSSSSYQKVYGN